MDTRSNTIISYFIENETKEDEYIFEFIFDTLGFNSKKIDTPIDASICYVKKFNAKGLSGKSIIFQKDESHVIWDDLIINKVDASSLSNVLPFDIINALAFFLLDKGNKELHSSSFDEHQRLISYKSFQFRNGIGAVPIVNKYILFLKVLLEYRLDIKLKPFYPNGKKACVILSHDVDRPDKHAFLKNYPLIPKDKNCNAVFKHYRHLMTLIKGYLLDRNRQEYWCFDEIIKEELRFGFKSTSYFAVINNFHKDGHILDVSYSINYPKFKTVFKKMRDHGFEVGLHASYNAFIDKARFNYEKATLEVVSKSEIIGLRHHYWHLGKDVNKTLLMHEEAGFCYDSSLAFNDNLGFRYNVALPFYPYITKLNRRLNVLQIPVFCMDGNLFYNNSMTVNKAVSEISKYFDILENNFGVGAIDWHIRTSCQKGDKYLKWGEAYMKILEILAERDDIWVTSAADFYKWWNNRISS